MRRKEGDGRISRKRGLVLKDEDRKCVCEQRKVASSENGK